MISKIDWSAIADSAKSNKGKIIICVIALGVILGALFFSDRISSYMTTRKTAKQKANIANGVKQIQQDTAEINKLEGRRDEMRKSVEAETKEFTDNVYGLEDQKAETNKALSNFNTALKSNSNVNATAEDLIRVVDKIEGMQ